MAGRKSLIPAETIGKVDEGKHGLEVSPVEQAEKPEQREHTENAGKQDKKERLTVHLDPELIKQIRSVCYWDREALTDFAETAFRNEIERREVDRGEPYPTEDVKLKRGRPVR